MGRGRLIVCGREGRSRGVLLVCECSYLRLIVRRGRYRESVWCRGSGVRMVMVRKGDRKLAWWDCANVQMVRIDDINKNCLEEFRKHWQCLDSNNQQLWHCRRPEQLLNACVFDKLVSFSL